MHPAARRRIGNAWFWATLGTFLAAAAYLVVLALGGEGEFEVKEDALPLLVVTLLVGVAGLVGGWREHRRALEEVDDLAGLEEERQAHARSREQLGTRLQERERELEGERAEVARLRRAREAEKAWNAELRSEVFRMSAERGVLADSLTDIRELVLRVAVNLTEAEKGLLLSREDQDEDGRLDLAAAIGFDNDPESSEVAQRFAGEVIERDTTVREDDSREIERERDSAADQEIRNLVAIPIYIQDRFSGAVVCANRPGGFEELDDDVLLALGDHAGAILQNGRLHRELRGSYLATVGLLAEAMAAKDPFLRGHSDEVSEYVAAVCDELDVPQSRREELIFASLLHDVGKIGVSERILLKPAALTPEERGVVELHPRIGYRLVQRVPALRPIAPAILHHHERFDGNGYPAGLSGDEIPIEARIICVADSFSAMTAERPYRRRMSLEDACAELERCAGSQFDPEVVRVFTDEVRCRPRQREDALAAALDDPDVESRRNGHEPVLGYGAQVVTDNLTLLYTHRYFHEAAAAESRRAQEDGRPFGVVLVELTQLADLNRLEGYDAGDAALQAVARVVAGAALRCGGTACRYRGDQIGLIAPGADEQATERIAREIDDDIGGRPPVRVMVAAWRSGESGEEVVARARVAPSLTAAPAPVAPPAPG